MYMHYVRILIFYLNDDIIIVMNRFSSSYHKQQMLCYEHIVVMHPKAKLQCHFLVRLILIAHRRHRKAQHRPCAVRYWCVTWQDAQRSARRRGLNEPEAPTVCGLSFSCTLVATSICSNMEHICIFTHWLCHMRLCQQQYTQPRWKCTIYLSSRC